MRGPPGARRHRREQLVQPAEGRFAEGAEPRVDRHESILAEQKLGSVHGAFDHTTRRRQRQESRGRFNHMLRLAGRDIPFKQLCAFFADKKEDARERPRQFQGGDRY
jgi:hypothetical protein